MKEKNELNESYVKVSTCAKMKNISSTRVYQLELLGKIEIIKIDGMKFVNLEKENNNL
mgnify:CR=1 FL=1